MYLFSKTSLKDLVSAGHETYILHTSEVLALGRQCILVSGYSGLQHADPISKIPKTDNSNKSMKQNKQKEKENLASKFLKISHSSLLPSPVSSTSRTSPVPRPPFPVYFNSAFQTGSSCPLFLEAILLPFQQNSLYLTHQLLSLNSAFSCVRSDCEFIRESACIPPVLGSHIQAAVLTLFIST